MTKYNIRYEFNLDRAEEIINELSAYADKNRELFFQLGKQYKNIIIWYTHYKRN